MKHYLSILILSLLLLVACDPTAELGTPFHKGQEVVLTAAIGEQRPQMMPQKHPQPQRISGKDDATTINLLWDEGDEILVRVGDETAVFTLTDGAGTANASFMGTMPASGSSFEVSYPVDYSDTILQQQTYVPNGIVKGLMKMSTPSPGTIDDGFTLQAQHAVLGLQLTGNSEISKIVLTKNDADGQAASPSYTLNCTSIVHGKLSNSKSPGVTLTETATLFYIVLPVGTWEHGFTVDVYAADNTTIIDTFVTNKRFKFTATNATMMAAKDVQDPPKRIGIFSVGGGKKVSFSQGNLQYTQSTNTWQFAREQYEYIGEANMTDGALADRIDLFGWSTDNPLAKWGLVFIMNNEYYHGSFVDWGTNTISGDAPNTWRTLSKDEWLYLLQTRPTSNMRYTYGNINGINGVFLFPDHWSDVDGIPLTFSRNYETNTLSLAQWELLENVGVVFLPSCGVYMGKIYNHPNTGLYWSSTAHPSDERYAFSIYIAGSIQEWGNNRATNRSVRLVHDSVIPEYVDLGLSVKWATFNVGASNPEDYGDYFAWGETEPKEVYKWENYKWCDGTQNTMTKYNATDGKIILDSEDDAAHVHWGGKWRMPTKEEMQELFDNCTWKEETRNAINGYIVTGPNGNSIFIPTAGFYQFERFGTELYKSGYSLYYRTNTLNPSFQSSYSYGHAYDLSINDVDNRPDGIVCTTRRNGFPIRPVYNDTPAQRSRGF